MRAGRRSAPFPRGRNAEAGFTLVELLVALTLLALVSIMLFGGLRFGARSWEAVAERSDRMERIAGTQTFLRRQLSQAATGAGAGGAAGAENVALVGEPDRLSFAAPWLSAISLGGLYRFDLLHEGGEDGRLVLAWRPLDIDPATVSEDSELVGRRTLLDGVSSVELSYFGARDLRADAAWGDAWEAPSRAPRLVRLALTFADDDSRWPPLVVAVGR